MKRRLELIDSDGQKIRGQERATLTSLLRMIGIPPRTRTIRIDLHGADPVEGSMQVTARPARKGSKPIVEDLEIHWPH